MSTHNLCFEQKYEKKISEFFYLKILVFGGEIFCIFEKVCFRNEKDFTAMLGQTLIKYDNIIIVGDLNPV